MIGADGRGERRLTSPRGETLDLEPIFSPSGGKVAFARLRAGGDGDILQMRAEGSRRRHVTEGPAADLLPDWQPRPAAAG